MPRHDLGNVFIPAEQSTKLKQRLLVITVGNMVVTAALLVCWLISSWAMRATFISQRKDIDETQKMVEKFILQKNSK